MAHHHMAPAPELRCVIAGVLHGGLIAAFSHASLDPSVYLGLYKGAARGTELDGGRKPTGPHHSPDLDFAIGDAAVAKLVEAKKPPS